MNDSFKDQFKNNIRAEWACFKLPVVFSGILFGAVMQWVHNIAHNYVYYLAGVYGVYGGSENHLTDLGFKALQPSIAYLSFLPSNGCLYSLGAIAVVVAVSPLFTDKVIRNKSVRVVQILWRALLVCSITICLRCISFLLTILPSPAPHCSQADFDPPAGAYEIFFVFDTENGCSDLIFSSHMMYGIIAASLVTLYTLKKPAEEFVMTRLEKWLKYSLIFIVWSLVVAEGFCIVAQESHYSIDVWTAFYAVPLAWVGFYHFFPNDPSPTIATSSKRPDQHEVVTPAPAAIHEWSDPVV